MNNLNTRTQTAGVAIIGNPNSGKTTLFNGLTGSRQQVGNWPGVTVEKKEGLVRLPGVVAETSLIDLPGIYSLNATSQDELIARDELLSGEFDLVINVVDASNLERNLYLTVQLIEMGVPLFVVLTMVDIAEAQGAQIDLAHLAKHLDCPVVGVNATTKAGIDTVRSELAAAIGQARRSGAQVAYPDAVRQLTLRWADALALNGVVRPTAARYTALHALEGDPWAAELIETHPNTPHDTLGSAARAAARHEVEAQVGEEIDIVVADARYGFIHGVSRDVTTRRSSRETVTERIDQVVMHRYLGLPLFLGAMYLVFWFTIAVGGSFIEFFEILSGTIFVDGLGLLVGRLGAPAWFTAIVADGIGTGIQTVATFVPIIFAMFFMLALLEDSGYMARAAFVMDRFMRWLGLPGKSFVPMLVGFGCTVPAITATRTLDSRKDRFMTIFMAPLMSCGARLPVYALFAAALFPQRAGLVVFSLYAAGLVLAIVVGLVLKRTLFVGETSHFVMELPPYHAPRLGQISKAAWRRLRVFVVNAGVTIIIVVAILSVLNTVGIDGSFGNEDSEQSVLATIGRSITPVFEPMGIERDNWPATVGLFTGLFAKEAIVGTLGSLYVHSAESVIDPEAADDEAFSLVAGLQAAVASITANLAGVWSALADPFGVALVGEAEESLAEEIEVDHSVFGLMRSNFSRPAAYAYLLFVLIYFPCVAALGAAIGEMGTGYGWLLAGFLTVSAWSIATLVYQFTSGPAVVPVAAAAALLVGMYVLLAAIGRHQRRAGA